MEILPSEAQRWRTWSERRQITPERLQTAHQALDAIRGGMNVLDALRKHALPEGRMLSKSMLVAAYQQLTEEGEIEEDPALLERIRLKPMRTLSGVTTVTILTKPYPCPGKCVFCPTDARMPKSYLPDEPGAMRALQFAFDPYDQVAGRLQALRDTGHPTDKIELLILGGTWSSYRRDYQEEFVLRVFEALNGVPSASLEEAHQRNEQATHRNVGLVIETRPDHVTPEELRWLRRLGVTKVQMGAQSLDDRVLEMNKRGHDSAETLRAVQLLRAFGFKVVLHMMPNLLGATPESDRQDFERLWQGFSPDEIKIYPTQLLANAELYEFWQRGEYTPYTTETLINLLADIKTTIPEYCRVNRVIRDIPSTNVVEGNRRTSLRMDVHAEMQRRGTPCRCIRCREVGRQAVQPNALEFQDFTYVTGTSEEHFLSYVTPQDKIAGFLRLSLPLPGTPATGVDELAGAAIIREVHVYGQSLEVGADRQGAAQHSGLGTQLIEAAEEITRHAGYSRLAVIAAVGTRQYYLRRGFKRAPLYLVKHLDG